MKSADPLPPEAGEWVGINAGLPAFPNATGAVSKQSRVANLPGRVMILV
jgi:hypothetical protein